MKNVKALVWKLRGLSSSFKCLAHYISLALNNIAVSSFPAAANQQPTAGPSDTDRQQNSAYPGVPLANELSPPLNGPEDLNSDRSASENNDNNTTQPPGSIDSRPVQEEERDGRTRTGEERDQQEETGNTGFILEISQWGSNGAPSAILGGSFSRKRVQERGHQIQILY